MFSSRTNFPASPAGTVSQAPPLPQSEPPAPAPAVSVVPGAPLADGAHAAAAPPAGQGDTAATPGAVPAGAAASQQAPLVVVLTMTDPCWLSVTVDGARTPSRTAGAGERLEFAVKRSITMTVGNAAALSVTLNGKPARALGAAGQVVTTTIPASGYDTFLR